MNWTIVAVVLSSASLLGGVSYWAGRLARALEGIESTLSHLAARQDETERHVTALASRVHRLEVLEER